MSSEPHQDGLDPELVELGHRLESLRARGRDASGKRLTLRDVSIAVGISAATLSEYERGFTEPSARRLKRLCDYYGVTLDWMLDELGTTRVFPHGQLQLLHGEGTSDQLPLPLFVEAT